MKNLISSLFVLVSLTIYAQNEQAKILYDKGIEAFNVKNYKTADSLLSLSAKLYADKDTYINLALVKNELGDHCAYCAYLLEASKLKNRKAERLHKKSCIIKDTIKYLNIAEKNVSYYCVSLKSDCSDKRNYEFYKKYLDKDSVISFKIIPSDSFSFKEEDCLSPTFEIEKTAKENLEITLKPPPYILIDEMPQYPGGKDSLNIFLVENIVYPKYAKRKNIHGMVYVTFIVETDGTINDVKVLRGIGGGCDEEAVRVVKMMPKWTPGNLKGKKVRVQFNLPIKFILYD